MCATQENAPVSQPIVFTPLGWEIYGAASDAAVATMQEAAKAAGVDLGIAAQHLGGFLRFVSR
jgi:hypothetical protein